MMFRDTMETIYPLGDTHLPLVRHGDRVAAGDIIAHGSAPIALAAYAATLRLSVEQASDEIARHHEAACVVGASLGTRRVGLVSRTVSAPATGIAYGLPQSGALAIRSDTADHEHRARYGGVVRDICEHAITITTAVARCVYGFAVGDIRDVGPLHIEPALLDAALTTGTAPRTVPSASSLVVAHIGDAATLHMLSRTAHETLFVGSVTEPVAWALLARPTARERRQANGPGIVVLSGVGDDAHGVHAVASFRGFHGATALVNRFIQTVTIIPSGEFGWEAPDGPQSEILNAAECRDPANYDLPCDIHGAPFVAILHTGMRVLCVQTGDDQLRERSVPLQNLTGDTSAKSAYVR